jgi:hypothetical protein
MAFKQILSIFLVFLLFIASDFVLEVGAEETEEIAPLTVPASDPNPFADIDVFERLEKEKSEGYLKDRTEIIEDSYYFTTKQGFDYIHLEGTYADIGYNHGLLLYEKIERGMAAYAYLTEYRYNMNWDICRAQGASYWSYVPADYQDEIDGIARGASEMNARNPDGAVIDRWDIMAFNSMWDIWWRTSPPGNLLWWWPFSAETEAFVESPHHCSGFVATGEITKDGGFVVAQNLWMPYYLAPSHAVFADIVPPDGNRILMELQAGMIWSGTEWYLNEAGLVIAETTLGTGPYRWGNVPSFVRLRNAVQYASSIDEFKEIMMQDTNGAYCGDYLIGDAKTNEVGIVELGSYEYEVFKTSDGFHGSCNYPWDPEVRDEMGAPEGWDHSCYPRYMRLEQIAEKYYGEIDTEIGKRALGDHWDTVEEKENKCSWTLEGRVENASGYPHGALDGKVTNRSMVQNYEVWAKFGFPSGEDFLADVHAAENPDYAFPNLIDIYSGPWTTFGFLEPITVKVVDKKGNPVKNAQIAFENRADGYLAEGITNEEGIYSHQYFQTGSYIITAQNGGYRGHIRVEFNQKSSLEVVLSEDMSEKSSLFGTTTFIGLAFIILIAIVAAVIYKKYFNQTKAKSKAAEK